MTVSRPSLRIRRGRWRTRALAASPTAAERTARCSTRIHGTTKRQVAAMFAEERPALGPLPLEPFRYYQYGWPPGSAG